MATDPSPQKMSRWVVLPIIASVVFTGLSLHAAYVETPTVDEFVHVPAGCAYLDQGAFGHSMKDPPLMKSLMAIPIVIQGVVNVPEASGFSQGWGPWEYGYRFMAANEPIFLRIFFPARIVVITCGMLTGFLIFLWSRRLFGVQSAAMVTTLFYLSPILLAHAHLATTDIGATLSIVLTMTAFRWAFKGEHYWKVGLAGFSWGIALLIKFTAVLLLPALCILLLCHRFNKPGRGTLETVILFSAALFAINLGMGFQGSFGKAGDLELVSSFGQSLQRVAPSWIPVPLPKDYVLGFDVVKHDTEVGEFGSYLFGQWSDGGSWYYNFVSFAVKTPVPLLVMLLVCPWYWRRAKVDRIETLTLVLPLASLFIMLTVFNRVNIGIRYLLPMYPFLFILIAPIFTSGHSLLRTWAPAAAIVYYCIIAAFMHPGHIGFFNAIAGYAPNGHRILADSNIDWGQDLYRLKPALDKLGHEGKIPLLYFGHVDPALYDIEFELVPAEPISSLLAVSVNYVVGYPYPATNPYGRMVPIASDHLDWLRGHEPIMRLGSIWVFDTREDETS